MTREEKDCPFCAIARGEDDEADIVCAGDSWVAFFPLDPATVGHTLIIPRRHVSDLWDLDLADVPDLGSAAVRVGRAIKIALEPDGMNLITSAGEAAEQTVFHLHLHLVPRWRRDGFDRIWPPNGSVAERLKDDAAERIRKECRSS